MLKKVKIILSSAFVLSVLGLTIVLGLTQSNVMAEEKQAKKAVISDEQKEWLRGLGFSPNSIENMSDESFDHISKQFKGVTGKPIKEKVEYHKVEYTLDEKGKVKKVKMIKKTKEDYEKAKKEKDAKRSVSILGTWDDTRDSWIKQRLYVGTISGSGNGDYMAQTSYEWLEPPFVAYSDVTGITHGNNVDKVAGTEYGEHWYYDDNGYHTADITNNGEAESKDPDGYADKFDLKLFGTGVGDNLLARDHGGYFYITFDQDNSFDDTADLYGHYVHALTSSFFNISVSKGGISLAGSSESQATDTHVDFTY
ncbi:hypothetical protein [Chengkuizengella marina]|uniref:Uncharacterized protein n=1 Tax=Chengkuizengella marina TaxID=2507566 RepID=A0A6N9Q264_9BACL|nr:hypothetical protein [Chengkuizengella marina]NBI28640.1 hypothetical protein [Chengkuizengella marina]